MLCGPGQNPETYCNNDINCQLLYIYGELKKKLLVVINYFLLHLFINVLEFHSNI